MKEFNGVNIKEVWDYRLSTAIPLIMRTNTTWIVQIWSKSGHDTEPLEQYDTGMPVEDGDVFDKVKITLCFQWLYSRRDDYALSDIELRKPVVGFIEEARMRQADLHMELQTMRDSDDKEGVYRIKEAIRVHADLCRQKIDIMSAGLEHDGVSVTK